MAGTADTRPSTSSQASYAGTLRECSRTGDTVITNVRTPLTLPGPEDISRYGQCTLHPWGRCQEIRKKITIDEADNITTAKQLMEYRFRTPG